MRIIKIILTLMLLSKALWAQNDTLKSDPDADKVFVWVEQMPYYKGGDKQLTEFLKKEMDSSKTCSPGWIYYQLTIMKDSTVGEIRILKSTSNISCDSYFVDLLKKSNQWVAGQQNKHLCKVTIFVTIEIKPKFIEAKIKNPIMGNKE